MPIVPILSFAALYAFATVAWGVAPFVGAVYVVASVACFALYAVDKAAARRGRWRTSEATLLLVGLACGWPGAMLAQQWLRHKTQKRAFLARFRATVAVNCIAFACLAAPLPVLHRLLP